MWNRRKSERRTPAPTEDKALVGTASTPNSGSLVHIGASMTVSGEFFSAEDTRIDGIVEGRVVVMGCPLTVGPDGRVDANVVARELILMGTIHGDVEVTGGVTIHRNASLTGNVRARKISIEEGGFFQGIMERVDPDATPLERDQLAQLAQAVEQAGEDEEVSVEVADPIPPGIQNWETEETAMQRPSDADAA